MSRPVNHSYEFGCFRVDVVERRLFRAGERVALPPKTFDTLVALVQNSGHLLTKDELIKTVWPGTFIEENNLTQHISSLRKALGDKDNGLGYIETVPRVGYRFAPGVREVWDEGEDFMLENHTKYRIVVKEEEFEDTAGRGDEETLRQKKSRFFLSTPRLSISLSILLVSALLGLAALLFVAAGSFGKRQTDNRVVAGSFKSVAVLPFKSIGVEQADEHLGLGMADSLIAKLSHVRQIKVSPFSAVQRFNDLSEDPFAAGRALGVDAVLDGRFQRANGRIRVTVELLSVRDGIVLWTAILDEDSAEIFTLQDQIAARVTSSLPQVLTGEESRLLAKSHTTNPQAYEAYALGRFFWNKRTKEGFSRAVDHFRRAISLDPNYALAYAGLADCYVLGADPLPLKEHTRRMKETAGKALELDDTLAEAHASLAYYSGAVEWDWQAAEKGFKRAIELNSNYATAHHWYAYHLAAMGRLEEALIEIRRARDLDPLSLIINTDVGHILYLAQQFDEAIVHYRRVLAMDSSFAVAHWRLGEAYIEKGMYEDAVAELTEASRLGIGDPFGWVGYAHASAGRKDAAQKAVTELQEHLKPNGGHYRFRMAAIHAALGNQDEALALLEESYEARDPGELVLIKVDPKLAELRSHPRFASLLSRMKLTS